ncbi:MAG: arginase family protein, partial [Planctomycetota bacterium]|nr:arginase family protein [Planctomycetota bacterium]
AMARGETWHALMEQALEPLPQRVWITFDVDGLQPTLCPNTGTPVPGGLSWSQANVLLYLLGKSGRKIVGFDLCEVGPKEWDANVGARLLYKLAGWAIMTSDAP